MAKMDFKKDYYDGLSGWYLWRVLDGMVKLGNLDEELGLILDYGGGFGRLRQLLPNKNIVIYDTEPSLNEVKNVYSLKPDVLFCNGVFEYMTLAEISGVFYTFFVQNPDLILLCSIAKSNALSRLAMVVSSVPEAHDMHVTCAANFDKNLVKSFEYCDKKDILGIRTLYRLEKFKYGK